MVFNGEQKKCSPKQACFHSDFFFSRCPNSSPRPQKRSTVSKLMANTSYESFIVSPQCHLKMLMHCVKYPHATVSGVLLASAPEAGASTLEFVDVVPLFHLGHGLTPMMETALVQVSAYCKEHKLIMAGYYQANKYFHDASPDIFAQKIAEKINEFNSNSVLVMVSNLGLASGLNEPTDAETVLHLYTLHEGKSWKHKHGLLRLRNVEASFKLVSQAIHDEQLQYDLVDFDNHLDDVSQDWSNKHLDERIQSLLAT